MTQSVSTICVQGGYHPGDGEPRQVPIYQSTTWKYDTSEHMGKLFDLEESGYFYTRLQNPTNDYVANKICELEGGTAAMLTSSGQAANFFSIFNIAGNGDHVVCSSAIYGGTYNLFAHTMARMGLECTFVTPNCTDEELEAAFQPNTKAVFGETIANPALSVFVAATGQDEDNLAACEIATRVFDVPRSIARVNSPKNLRIFRRLGIESISSTALIAHMIEEEAMMGSMSAAVTLTSDQIALTEIKVPNMRFHDNYHGIRALDLEFGEGVRLVAVSHADEVEVVGSETRILPGDQVIVAADTDRVDEAIDLVRSL